MEKPVSYKHESPGSIPGASTNYPGNEFRYVGVWANNSGTSSIVYIYNSFLPAFEMKLDSFPTGEDGPYKIAAAIVALLNAGMKVNPELIEPFIKH
jgi:hypothetical protein